jgi:chemotaxis protein CheD
MKRIILNIGDVVASTEPSILETSLGSCVSVCLWDETLRIGGMNHFMMPRMTGNVRNPTYCGKEAIEVLVSALLDMGSNLPGLKAKVFGGGRVIKEFQQGLDIGKENIRVAKETLGKYGIPIIKELTGKDYGVKVVFYSATGKAFIRKIKAGKEDDKQQD